MNLFSVLDISGSALLAERQRAEVVASNLANAETTKAQDGAPYRREHVIFAASSPFRADFGTVLASLSDLNVRGVRVNGVIPDPTPPVRRFDPSDPDADAQGYVSSPSINPLEEVVNLMGAARSYQINVAAVQATKNMITAALQIGA